MSRHPPFMCGDKPQDRKVLASWKQCTTRENTRLQLHKTHSRVQIPSSIRSKSFPARSNDRRGKVFRKAVKLDLSSTESTNASEKEKMNNVLTLRKEIDEWKRQEAARSKVIQIIGSKDNKTDGTFNNDRKEDTYAEPCVIQPSQERAESTSETARESRDPETVRQLTTAVQKQDKGTMPAVTWIDVQPESSARTSIKSFTDYLTESQDDAAVFTPSNRLCLSPETLNALDSAEKLVDDVERQLSQMQFDDSLTDDTEEFNGIKLNDERLHVQNIVKAVFQKGYYEPAPRPIFNQDKAAWKRRKDKPSRHKSSRVVVPSKPIDRGVEPSPVDECLLCKSGKAESTNEHPKAQRVHVEETKINEDKAEKLHVQRAPPVSIKGPLAVQTARIVDIQPDERRVPARRPPNIVTHECRHLEPMPSVEATPLETQQQQQRKSTDKSALNYSYEAPLTSEENRAWHEYEEARLDLEDFGLTEPRILVEVDAVLEQQRNVIRRVHEATDKFDRFLAKNRVVESSHLSVLDDRSHEKRMNETIDAQREKSLSISLKPTKSATISKRSIHDELNASSTAPSENSNKIFEDPSKQNLAGKSSVEDAQYSESFESESSADKSESDKSRSVESGIQLKNTDKEVSSNNSSLVKSSVPTETKSNAGFIENLKSSMNLKENNLASHLREKASDSSVAIENDNVDRNLNLNENSSVNVMEKHDEEKRLDKKKENELRTSETDDERELYNYQFDADLLEEMNELVVEMDKRMDEKVDDDAECKKDGSTEKLQNNPDENSQKTSHMIDSIPDVSSRETTSAKNSQESQKMSSASNHELSEARENSAIKELSTESKIEMKLSEARDNLKILMRTMNASVNNGANDERESSHIAAQERDQITEMGEQRSADDGVPQIMKNITLRTNDARRKNSRISMNANAITPERINLSNDRSYLAVLQENSEARQNSLERQKLLLLTNLESCRIQSPNRAKRLFTSTIVDDAEPPVNFTRSKESSTIRRDSLSDSNSEGEIRLNSTASHSLGEIRRKTLESKSSCSTKGSTTTSSANLNNSSSRSAGELDGISGN